MGVFLAIAIVALIVGGLLYLRSLPPASTTVVNAPVPATAAPAMPAPLAPAVPAEVFGPEPEMEAEPSVDMNSVPELLSLGNAMLKEGKADLAEKAYRRAIEVNPEDEDTHFNLGVALGRQGRAEEAIAAYNRALEIYADYVEARHNLANVMMQLGRTNDAIAQLERAIGVNPDYAPVVNNLGRLRAMQAQWDEAFELLEQAVELDPESHEYQFNLGTARLQKGDFAKAADALEQAYRLKPEHLLTVNLYVQALAYNQQPDRAMEVLKATLERVPNNIELRYNLGQLQLHNGQLTAAQENFERVVREVPDFAAARNSLAEAKRLLEEQANPELKSTN